MGGCFLAALGNRAAIGGGVVPGARAAGIENRARLVAESVCCGAYLLRDVGIGRDCRRALADAG